MDAEDFASRQLRFQTETQPPKACKMYKDAQRTDFRRVQCAADVAGALHLTRAWGSTDGGSQWDWATELA
jgi:hypothetical protein